MRITINQTNNLLLRREGSSEKMSKEIALKKLKTTCVFFKFSLVSILLLGFWEITLRHTLHWKSRILSQKKPSQSGFVCSLEESLELWRNFEKMSERGRVRPCWGVFNRLRGPPWAAEKEEEVQMEVWTGVQLEEQCEAAFQGPESMRPGPGWETMRK